MGSGHDSNRQESTTHRRLSKRGTIVGVVGLAALFAAASNCGSSDTPPASDTAGDAGPTITCGAGTVLKGTTCVLDSDGGVAGAAGASAGGSVSCGPGTVLKDNQCVSADSGSDGLSIDSFTATKLSGDVPLDTKLTWTIHAPQGAKFSCQLDIDGDGTFETDVPDCPATGEHAVTYDSFGEKKPVLRVIPEGAPGGLEASESIFANQVKWAKNLVKVHELPGLVSSKLVDEKTVELAFDKASNVPKIQAGALVWDKRAGGYVRNVMGVKTSGTKLTLDVTQASIFDIATDGFWGRRDRPEDMKVKSFGGDACDPSAFGSTWDVKVLPIGGLKIEEGHGALEVKDAKLLIASKIMDPAYSFGWFQENIFSANMMFYTRICANVEASLQAKLEKHITLPAPGGFDLDFYFFHATGGFVPQVGVEATGSIVGSFDAVFGTFVAGSIDYRSDHGGFTPDTGLVIKKDYVSGLYNPQVTAKGEVKLYAKPAFEITWNGDKAECNSGKTKNDGSFKLAIEPEFGVKSTVTMSVQNGNIDGCLDGALYAGVTATAIPPFKVIDCLEWNKSIDLPFYHQCWSTAQPDAGTDGGADASMDGGTDGGSDASTDAAAETGAGGSAGQGGGGGAAGQGGTAGQGGNAGTGGQGGAAGSGGQDAGTVVPPGDGHRIAANLFSMCVVTPSHTVKCWGANSFGQLGNGTSTPSKTPVQVSGLSGVDRISGKANHFCARLTNGTVECWGANHSGQLGSGTHGGFVPVPVEVVGLTGVRQVSAGGEHTCAVLSDGTVECWGRNGWGELGDGTKTDSDVPVKVNGLSNVIEVAAGGSHTCALLADRSVKCWGRNGNCELGNGTTTNSTSPVAVKNLPATAHLGLQGSASYACLTNGLVVHWGYTHSYPYKITDPVVVGGVYSCQSISVQADSGGLSTTTAGAVLSWGAYVGDGSNQGSDSGVLVQGLPSAVDVAAGAYHKCVLTTDNRVFCWGDNKLSGGQDTGYLGTGSTKDYVLTPEQVQGL